jgi:hypothetical protein
MVSNQHMDLETSYKRGSPSIARTSLRKRIVAYYINKNRNF